MITSSQVHTNVAGSLDVTLKINRTDLEAVVSSFERHDFKVKEVYGGKNDTEDTLDRYNLLMNYINM